MTVVSGAIIKEIREEGAPGFYSTCQWVCLQERRRVSEFNGLMGETVLLNRFIPAQPGSDLQQPGRELTKGHIRGWLGVHHWSGEALLSTF